MPGPIPNRSDQRVRRNKPEIEIDTVDQAGTVTVPELGLENPHQIVADFWDSLAESGQANYYEPSDWQYARVVMKLLDQQLKSYKPSGQMIATLHSMLTDLLVSEGARRRVRMEVERNKSAADQADTLASVSDIFRDRLAQ